MVQHDSIRIRPHNVALIGNFLPRKCGIATFSKDLQQAIAAESPGSNCYAVAMNDTVGGYSYPDAVRFEVYDKRLSDYQLAADFLNVNQVSVVCVQHEFGIFGGPYGAYLLPLLRSLRMPIVTTFHTVLSEPLPEQRAIVDEIGKISDRVVVMSRKAEGLLRNVYGVAANRIAVIPHGIPDMPFVDPSYFKGQFRVEGRKVLLTFGLLSPSKGIEYMIEALPEIVNSHPDVVYIVLGATHPHVTKDQGESYRLSLQRRARELGVENHVIYHNRFVELTELCEFLSAADLYVTPYLAKEQIVSGTLAYALGAGKATISTPYWYAEEMLADGRGRLIPFQDSTALAEQIVDLLDHETERDAMRKRAYTYCREMIWKEVARKYLEVFLEVERKRLQIPKPSLQTKAWQSVGLELPQINFDHLLRLTDDVGILQHAKFIVPNRDHGYCTDDNARALIAVLMANQLTPDGEELRDLDCRYLSFLMHAFNSETKRFRNFLGYDRNWLEEVGSEDSHGRAVWALGVAIGLGREEISDVTLDIFDSAVSTVEDFTSPRAWAFAIVGVHAYLRRFGGNSGVRRIRERLANQLLDLYLANASEDWPWIEQVVTYDNGKIPQALIMSGVWLQHGAMIDAGLRSLEWLVRIETAPKGHFAPIGNQGWYSRQGKQARFDQQPLEAQSLLEACMEAFTVTQDKKWLVVARRCLDWFMGRNDLDAPLCDYKTGGCCDGLAADGSNRNQGAEATLSWLLSLLRLLSFEHFEDNTIKPATPVAKNSVETTEHV